MIIQKLYKEIFCQSCAILYNMYECILMEKVMMDVNSIIKKNLHRGAKGCPRFKKWLVENKFFARKNVDRYAFKRHDRIIKRYYPGLFQLAIPEELASRRVVEIGCGSGSASTAFAQITKEVFAFDIERQGIRVARKRARCFGIKNIEFSCVNEREIIDSALELIDQNSIILLYAVLEHMTEQERLYTLQRIWSNMSSNNLLIIGELPNRLCYYDEHTYLTPFVHLLPDYTFWKYSKIEDFRFADYFRSLSMDDRNDCNFYLERVRRGLGCSFHEFQICFEDNLDECVVQTFQYPTNNEEELFLLKIFAKYNINIFIVFGCQMMRFAVQRLNESKQRQRIRNFNVEERLKAIQQT